MSINPKIKKISLGLLTSVLLPTNFVLAQQTQQQFPEPFAYPTKDQTQEQQQQDHFACYSWAKQQTGVDPSQLSTTTTSQSSQQGQVVRGAAKGSPSVSLAGRSAAMWEKVRRSGLEWEP